MFRQLVFSLSPIQWNGHILLHKQATDINHFAPATANPPKSDDKYAQKSVQLVRVSSFRSVFLQNPYFNTRDFTVTEMNLQRMKTQQPKVRYWHTSREYISLNRCEQLLCCVLCLLSSYYLPTYFCILLIHSQCQIRGLIL